MVTLNIEVPESAMEVIRQRAEAAGKTPEAWAAEVLIQNAAPAGNKQWMKAFLEDAEKVRGRSGGWKFNRDDLYDRPYPGKFTVDCESPPPSPSGTPSSSPPPTPPTATNSGPKT